LSPATVLASKPSSAVIDPEPSSVHLAAKLPSSESRPPRARIQAPHHRCCKFKATAITGRRCYSPSRSSHWLPHLLSGSPSTLITELYLSPFYQFSI
jgi:hypothetical protein